jgi:ribosomal protein S26
VFILRGKDTSVRCESCGRTVPHSKAVVYERSISFNTETRTPQDVRFFERRKTYYCISCAKHRGIFEKLKRQAIERSKREYG